MGIALVSHKTDCVLNRRGKERSSGRCRVAEQSVYSPRVRRGKCFLVDRYYFICAASPERVSA